MDVYCLLVGCCYTLTIWLNLTIIGVNINCCCWCWGRICIAVITTCPCTSLNRSWSSRCGLVGLQLGLWGLSCLLIWVIKIVGGITSAYRACSIRLQTTRNKILNYFFHKTHGLLYIPATICRHIWHGIRVNTAEHAIFVVAQNRTCKQHRMFGHLWNESICKKELIKITERA